MGVINNGILGGFSGKVGSVVGGSWRGKQTMRSRPTQKKNAKRTQPQLEHQAKFAVAAQFLQSMNDLLAVTFKQYAVGKTGANAALTQLLKNAITGTYPDYQIAYDKALVSKGSLLPAFDGKAAAGAPQTVQFTWSNLSGLGNANETDQVLLVVYCPELRSTVYKIGAARTVVSDSIAIPGLSGKVVQTWIGFISADRQDVSTSVFAGEVTIA